jgi:hypothetical protein
MAQYYSQNVTTRRNAAFQYLAARVEAGFAAMSRRQSGLRGHALVDDDCNRNFSRFRGNMSPRPAAFSTRSFRVSRLMPPLSMRPSAAD